MISGKISETTGSERLAGYKAALEGQGIPVRESLIAYGDYKEESGIPRNAFSYGEVSTFDRSLCGPAVR